MINIFIFLSLLKFTNLKAIFKTFKEKKFFFEDKMCLSFNLTIKNYLLLTNSHFKDL